MGSPITSHGLLKLLNVSVLPGILPVKSSWWPGKVLQYGFIDQQLPVMRTDNVDP